MKPWLLVVVLASGLSAQAVNESKPLGKELAIGYVVCSDRSEQFASMFLDLCRKLPAGRISCGQTVNIVQRRGDWLEIELPDGLSRYLPTSTVSRSAERFVPFDRDSGITDKGPVECPAGGPAPGSPLSDVVGPRRISRQTRITRRQRASKLCQVRLLWRSMCFQTAAPITYAS
jgi:hypothetical protein